MILLDTDILTLVLQDESPDGLRVRARVAQLPRDELVATTVINFEELATGWFGAISRARRPPLDREREIEIYARLVKLVDKFKKLRVVTYDVVAADRFDELRSQRIRVGTNDLRIAAITLSLNATLITRNHSDFARIPNLRIEDWTRS